MPAPRRISICLGSSCFARGASRFPAVVQAFLSERKLDAEVSGHLCRERCADGPMVSLDGTPHRVRDEAELLHLLAGAFAGADG